MLIRRHALAAFLAAIAFVALTGLSSAPASAADCGRDCLKGFLTEYADALVAQDPSKLPLTDTVRVTENGSLSKLGDGLWKIKLTKEAFRQDYLDVEKQVAAAHMHFMDGKDQILLSVVLHVADGAKISGVETLVQRVKPDDRFYPTELGGPIHHMNDPIPAGEKMSRANMVKIALTYTHGLRVGNFSDGGTPFAAETYRVENGVITAGVGCKRGNCGMYQQVIMVHPSIIASVAAVDEENGIVLLWMNFGFTNTYGPGNSLVTYEAFKVWGNQIHAINAFFTGLPVGRSRAWPTSDPVAQ